MLLELPVVTPPSIPGRRELWVRNLKVLGLSARRLFTWSLHPRRWSSAEFVSGVGLDHRLYERRIPVGRIDPDADPRMEAGKRRNLQLAAPSFDGLSMKPGRVLSFWRCLGRVRAQDGYVAGMELRGGCIVPALGGGLCLLSNALFEMAARLGFTIHERHGHTVEAVPSEAEPWGLDATIFWPYVDLRWESPVECRLSVRMEGEFLVIGVDAAQPWSAEVTLWSEDDRREGNLRLNRIVRRVVSVDGIREEVVADNRKRLTHSQERRRNCYTCGHTSCSARQGILNKAGGMP